MTIPTLTQLDIAYFFGYSVVDTNHLSTLFILNLNMTLDAIVRLSVSEAGRLFGVSQRTIRRAIKDQKVTYVVVQGRYKINFESLLRWSQETIKIKNKRDSKGMGQFVEQWRIKNKLFSPNPKTVNEK